MNSIYYSYQSNLSAPDPRDPPIRHPTPTTYHLITISITIDAATAHPRAAAAAASCHLINLNQIMLTTNPRGSSRCETRDEGIDRVVSVPTMLRMHATVPEGTATATSPPRDYQRHSSCCAFRSTQAESRDEQC